MQEKHNRIETELKKKLNPKHVKTRQKGNANLSYIEAWQCIEEANNVFYHDGWNRQTIYNKEVCRYPYMIGKDKYQSEGHKVGYEAKVLITVGDITREGTGHGSGIAKDLFDAIESAAKEAESDAMKRALMTFGYRFGLALYDKAQANVGYDAKPQEFNLEENYQLCLEQIKSALTKEQFAAIWNNPESKNRRARIKGIDEMCYANIISEQKLKLENFND